MEAKPYLVIARKYRPQTFDEVIGQDAIATTLKNAITLDRIGHAYLFTGPRGVGKTSMARIFAKALNCKDGPTITPCGKCQTCLEIEGARALDVLEIDGASNRGIDEIRTLRENVKFSPASGKFKIYIIDEVHQITPDGFNALLKTLEEPPAHVKFIFATTAANKVPATILSRCQRFDFRRIPTDRIVLTLKEICKKEKIKTDDDALFVIAKSGDGSLRDSQSILDQIAASTQDKITKDHVVQSLGSLEEERLVEIVDALAAGDAKTALLLLDKAMNEGKEPALFMEKLLEHARNLLFVQVSGELAELVDATESYKKELLRQKDRFSRDDLFYFFSVITHTLQIMKRFEAKRIPLEVALVKLAHRTPMQDISKALEQLKDLEKKTKFEPAGALNPVPAPRTAPVPPVVRRSVAKEPNVLEIEELPVEEVPVKEILQENRGASLETVWNSLIGALKTEKMSVASYLAEGEPTGLANGVAKISFPERLDFHRETLEATENKKLIERHLAVFLGMDVRVEFESVKEIVSRDGGQTPARGLEGAPAVPEGLMKSAMNLFGGRMVGQ